MFNNNVSSSSPPRASVPIAPRPIAVPSVQPTDVNPENVQRIVPTASELFLLDTVTDSLGGSMEIRQAVLDVFESSSKLERLAEGKGAVHCLITTTPDASQTILFPLVSKLLRSSLDASNPRSSIASQAILDAFLVARQISLDTSIRRNDSITLPSWFPWKDADADPLPNRRPTYIFCNNTIMERLLCLDALVISVIYGDLFNSIFKKGHADRIVSGRMKYDVLTPPWLRTHVVFLHGTSHNVSIPYNGCILPRKNTIRERGKKSLGCAILTTWLKEETSAVGNLIIMLKNNGIILPTNYTRNGVDDCDAVMDLSVPPNINSEASDHNVEG